MDVPSPDSLFRGAELQVNACRGSGERLNAAWSEDVQLHAATLEEPPPVHLDMAELEDPNCLSTMGWGLVLPEPKNGERPEQVQCPHLRRIWEHRGRQAIFRYRSDASKAGVYLRRYEADGSCCDVSFTADVGPARGQLPFYLLLAGSPQEIPWNVQFESAVNRAVGRLDLDDSGRANYANALVNDWESAATRMEQVLTWSVKQDEITKQMKKCVGNEFARRVDEDAWFEGFYLHSDDATVPKLLDQLRTQRPGLLLTTSHGCTEDARLAERLGLPHDQLGKRLEIEPMTKLLEGVVWYCLACSSAGGEGVNPYDRVLAPNCEATEAFQQVAALGALTSPMSKAILGAANPARAFLGHVGPTFDVTLKDFRNNLPLTNGIVDSLHGRYCLQNDQRWRLGRCLEPWRIKLSQMREQYLETRTDFNRRRDDAASWLLDIQLRAMDARRLVLLGDPALLRPPVREPDAR